MDEFVFPSTPRRRQQRPQSLTPQEAAVAKQRMAHLQDSPTRHRRSSTTHHFPKDQLEIVAPIPRRASALQIPDLQSSRWTSTPSPTSSRGISPSSSVIGPGHGMRSHFSFSTIHEYEHPVAQTREEDVLADAGLGRAWVRWMHKNGMRAWVVPSTLLASALVRWCVGLGSYSGQGTPPMFGDYEAQRHWMELTIHLPIRQWYTYDLQYWGLDYPPLTAYVSWLCGIVGSAIDASWFALDQSRGIETPESKVYMRATVFALDLMVYIPAIWLFVRTWHATRSRRTQHLSVLTLLLQPALLLIDFGHFQYNSVMLGFTILSINFLIQGQDLLGAFFFVLSLGFKQMALYYAPAIGSYLIGKCLYLGPQDGLSLFIRLATVTLASFTLLFLPFLPPFAPPSAILEPITRIFPFNRGIFEDKAANFWCASNVVLKWKRWASRAALVRLSTLLTVAGFVPAAVAPVRAWLSLKDDGPGEGKKADVPPSLQPVLLHALLSSAMSFFLFSFQVHEKTILLPLMPLTLLMSAAPQDSTTFKIGALANNVGVFSIWPLLKRDGQILQYIALLFLWNRIIGHQPFRLKGASYLDLLTTAIYTAILALHLLELALPPAARYPDLYAVLNVLLSTPIFALTWLWSMQSLVQARWAVGGIAAPRPPTAGKNREREREPEPLGKGLPRQFGARASSLGYAGAGVARRRLPLSGSKASSVSGGTEE